MEARQVKHGVYGTILQGFFIITGLYWSVLQPPGIYVQGSCGSGGRAGLSSITRRLIVWSPALCGLQGHTPTPLTGQHAPVHMLKCPWSPNRGNAIALNFCVRTLFLHNIKKIWISPIDMKHLAVLDNWHIVVSTFYTTWRLMSVVMSWTLWWLVCHLTWSIVINK